MFMFSYRGRLCRGKLPGKCDAVISRRDGKKTRGNVSVGFAKDALAAPPLSPPHRRQRGQV